MYMCCIVYTSRLCLSFPFTLAEPVDIFAEASSVAEASSPVEPAGSKDSGTPSSGAAPPFSNEVLWEYKWDKDSSDIHGPFSSTQMSDWVDSG